MLPNSRVSSGWKITMAFCECNCPLGFGGEGITGWPVQRTEGSWVQRRGGLQYFPWNGQLEFDHFHCPRVFIRHIDSGLLFVSQTRKGKGGRRCFHFYQVAASLRQSQPLRQRIYKFSCSGLINHEQHAAPWDRTFLGGPQQKSCRKTLLMSCSRNDQWTLNEDLGSGQDERKSGGPLLTSWPPKGREGPPRGPRSWELVTSKLVPWSPLFLGIFTLYYLCTSLSHGFSSFPF